MQTNEQLLNQALDATPAKIGPGKLNEFFDRLVREFLVLKIEQFPQLCEETRRINMIHNKELDAVGYKSPTRMVDGKMTGGTSGWSSDGSFKHKWIIPIDLKVFMRNCIYVDFWEDSNSKVRNSFMKAVVRGDDALELLKKVRTHYGTNASPIEREIVIK